MPKHIEEDKLRVLHALEIVKELFDSNIGDPVGRTWNLSQECAIMRECLHVVETLDRLYEAIWERIR